MLTRLYKNFKLIKERNGTNIWPFWRAFFGSFWAYSCFKEVKAEATRFNVWKGLEIGWLAIAYCAVFLLGSVEFIPSLLTIFAFVFFIPVNKLAQEVNEKAGTAFDNGKYTGKSWLALGLGSILIVSFIASSLLIEEPKTVKKNPLHNDFREITKRVTSPQ